MQDNKEFSYAAKLHFEKDSDTDLNVTNSYKDKFKQRSKLPSRVRLKKTDNYSSNGNSDKKTKNPFGFFKKRKRSKSKRSKAGKYLGQDIKHAIDKQARESDDVGVQARWELTKAEYHYGRKGQKKAFAKNKTYEQKKEIKRTRKFERRQAALDKDRLFEQKHGHKSIGGKVRGVFAKQREKTQHAVAQMKRFARNKLNKALGEKGADKAITITAKITRLLARLGRFLFATFVSPFLACIAALLVICFLGFLVFAMFFGAGAMMCSYTAEDAAIEEITLYATELEAKLEKKINDIPSEWEYQHIDEFNYDIDPIGHDPNELMAYLTVMYPGFKHKSQVRAEVERLHEERYKLDLDEEVEIRYREESYTDADGEEHTRMVPYEYYILNVTLKSKPLEEVTTRKLINHPQKDMLKWHDVILRTGGLKQQFHNPLSIANWKENITSLYGYRRDPIGKINLQVHHGIDIAAPQGTRIFAGTDGMVTAVGYSDIMGKYIIIENPKDKTEIKYAHCLSIFAHEGQEVKEGEFIAAVGNTGQSTGAHLHLEVKRDGQYLNPLFYFESERNDENEV